MAEISGVSAIMEKYGFKETSKTVDNSLNKDAFLNLLATQMKYQDPLEPTKNEEMLAQMAQFSALEQMQNISKSASMQQAYDLMGKTVFGTFRNIQTGVSEQVEGVVESVSIKSGETFVRVDGKDIELSKVEAVLDDSAQNKTELIEAIDKINKTLETMNSKLDELDKTTKALKSNENATVNGTINEETASEAQAS